MIGAIVWLLLAISFGIAQRVYDEPSLVALLVVLCIACACAAGGCFVSWLWKKADQNRARLNQMQAETEWDIKSSTASRRLGR
jgi:membrane protein DedA with SNARE-associated domain